MRITEHMNTIWENIDTILVTTRAYYALTVVDDDLIEVPSERLNAFAEKITALKKEITESQSEKAALLAEKRRASADDYDPFENQESDDVEDAETVESDLSITIKEPSICLSDVFKSLFISDGSAEDVRSYEGYWDNWDSKLFLKRIVVPNNTTSKSFYVYVAPCFPIGFLSTNYMIRHEYLNMLFSNLINSNAVLLAHDKDLYKDSDERSITEEDIHNGGNVLKIDSICLEQVFGFQHVNERNRIFSSFIDKLKSLTFDDCTNAIKVIQSDKKNREKFVEIDNYPFNDDGSFKKDGAKKLIDELIDEIII